jgi:hypothetical protein
MRQNSFSMPGSVQRVWRGQPPDQTNSPLQRTADLAYTACNTQDNAHMHTTQHGHTQQAAAAEHYGHQNPYTPDKAVRAAAPCRMALEADQRMHRG